MLENQKNLEIKKRHSSFECRASYAFAYKIISNLNYVLNGGGGDANFSIHSICALIVLFNIIKVNSSLCIFCKIIKIKEGILARKIKGCITVPFKYQWIFAFADSYRRKNSLEP